MSQHDYDIANGSGAAVRSDLIAAFQALVGGNSGATAPTTKFDGMVWIDTSVATYWAVKRYNSSTTTWITESVIDLDQGSAGLIKPRLPYQMAPTGLLITQHASTADHITVVFTSACLKRVSSGAIIDFMPVGGLSATTLDIDLTTTGANALDAGTFAANTWYYVYLINIGSVADAVAGLVSTSSTAPTLPATYTHYQLVGCFRSKAGPDAIPFRQQGNFFVYDGQQGGHDISASTASAWTDLSLAASVPPISTRAFIWIHAAYNNAGPATLQVRRNGSASTVGKCFSIVNSATTDNNSFDWCDTDDSQVVEYSTSAATTGSSLNIQGFKLNLW